MPLFATAMAILLILMAHARAQSAPGSFGEVENGWICYQECGGATTVGAHSLAAGTLDFVLIDLGKYPGMK